MTDFVVRPTAARVLASAFWLLGWGYLAAALLDPTIRLGAEVGGPAWLEVGVPWLFYGVHLLVGPLALLSVSRSLQVSGQQLRVDRLFGMRSTTYSRGEIQSTRYMEKRWQTPRTEIVFEDGRTVRFDAFATGFQHLRAYLWPASGDAKELPPE